MAQIPVSEITPDRILEFWYPAGLENYDPQQHKDFWFSRMQGEMDQPIIDHYALVTEAAARGLLDHWADEPMGRLALILCLDQFPRSLWRNTPGAFGQDYKATRLALEGLRNGHYDALDYIWQKNFYLIAISHCEGPDHLERMDLIVDLADKAVAALPEAAQEAYGEAAQQPRRVREIIRRFGRHPHRNPIYGRVSSPEEEAYIAEGLFPHERQKHERDAARAQE